MATARGAFHVVTLLDGRVLAVGNDNDCMPGGAFEESDLAELYDPATGRWSATGSLNKPRDDFAAVRLLDGRVLVTGGWTGWQEGGVLPYSSTKLYDPAAGRWTDTGRLHVARADAAAARLADGRVLVAGGYATSSGTVVKLGTAEIYDPATGRWTPTGRLVSPRAGRTAFPQPDGGVLLVGGADPTPRTIERYDPGRGIWRVVGSLPAGRDHVTVALGDGTILFAGGYPLTAVSGAMPLTAAWRFDPATGASTRLASMPMPRAQSAAVLLGDGRVLVAGGVDGVSTSEPVGIPHLTRSALIYDPSTDRWTETTPLPSPLEGGEAVLIGDGSVLIAGGVAEWGQPSTPWCPTLTARVERFVPAETTVP
jgi:N-acetylneuraminic acid mutarotase